MSHIHHEQRADLVCIKARHTSAARDGEGSKTWGLAVKQAVPLGSYADGAKPSANVPTHVLSVRHTHPHWRACAWSQQARQMATHTRQPSPPTCDGAQACIVPLAGVCAASADDEAGAVVQRLLLQLVVVDVAGLRCRSGSTWVGEGAVQECGVDRSTSSHSPAPSTQGAT